MAYPGSKYNPEGNSGSQIDLINDTPDRTRTWLIPTKENPMYQFQSRLPRLPVPNLEQTCLKYLKSCKPLATPEEYEITKKNVLEFLTNGSGEILQKRLQERYAAKADSSWLIDWWNGYSYFGYRDPVVFYVSYFYQFKPLNLSQTATAARLLKGTLKYRELIVTEQLPPEKNGNRPNDMSMYKYLFNASRLPKKPVDEYITYDPTYYHHIIVLRKNKFFKVNLIVDGVELSVDEIQAELEKIIKAAGDKKGPAIGALSSDNRDIWTDSRIELLNLDPSNVHNLEEIESAILLLCLDDVSPVTSEDKARALWHGDGCNRFYDKQQFIVAPNGECGFIGEHGMMDGTPTLLFTDWLLTQIKANKLNLGQRVIKNLPKTSKTNTSQLVFKVNSNIEASINNAIKSFNEIAKGHDLHCLEFSAFGKEGIKKCKVSPDAFCQMAIQLAYFRHTKKNGATYESCSTRSFLHGRTETIRSCSSESAAFVQSMCDPSSTLQERYRKLQAAASAQTNYAREAALAQGVDRHLLGLKLLRKDGDQATPIFDDPVFNRSKHWVLSTSTLASEHFVCWGFGEVVEDGFGIGYMCNSNSMAYTIVSRCLGAKELADHLESSLKDMYAMCQSALVKSKL